MQDKLNFWKLSEGYMGSHWTIFANLLYFKTKIIKANLCFSPVFPCSETLLVNHFGLIFLYKKIFICCFILLNGLFLVFCLSQFWSFGFLKKLSIFKFIEIKLFIIFSYLLFNIHNTFHFNCLKDRLFIWAYVLFCSVSLEVSILLVF